MCTTLVFIALAAAALIVVRRRASDRASFHAPGYPVTTVLFVLLIVSVVTLVGINQPLQAIAGFAIVLVGLPVHRFLARHQQ
jgi:basic amino acid/polyamine antiporter, APA family